MSWSISLSSMPNDRFIHCRSSGPLTCHLTSPNKLESCLDWLQLSVDVPRFRTTHFAKWRPTAMSWTAPWPPALVPIIGRHDKRAYARAYAPCLAPIFGAVDFHLWQRQLTRNCFFVLWFRLSCLSAVLLCFSSVPSGFCEGHPVFVRAVLFSARPFS